MNNKVNKIKILNWICDTWYNDSIIIKNKIEKSFIITGIFNRIEKSDECKQIEIYKWIKENI